MIAPEPLPTKLAPGLMQNLPGAQIIGAHFQMNSTLALLGIGGVSLRPDLLQIVRESGGNCDNLPDWCDREIRLRIAEPHPDLPADLRPIAAELLACLTSSEEAKIQQAHQMLLDTEPGPQRIALANVRNAGLEPVLSIAAKVAQVRLTAV